MVGRYGRLAGLGVAVALVVGGTVGCGGGDSDTKTIAVAVQPGESPEEWYIRALEEGSKACTGDKSLKQVLFGLEDEDERTEVASAVERGDVPSSVDCVGFVQQTTPSAKQ